MSASVQQSPGFLIVKQDLTGFRSKKNIYSRQTTHIAQDVRWTSILGPKIRLTSASSSDLKWTSIGCTFRYKEWTFMLKNQMDLKWTSIGCTILDEEWACTRKYEMDLKGTTIGCTIWDEEWT